MRDWIRLIENAQQETLLEGWDLFSNLRVYAKLYGKIALTGLRMMKNGDDYSQLEHYMHTNLAKEWGHWRFWRNERGGNRPDTSSKVIAFLVDTYGDRVNAHVIHAAQKYAEEHYPANTVLTSEQIINILGASIFGMFMPEMERIARKEQFKRDQENHGQTINGTAKEIRSISDH